MMRKTARMLLEILVLFGSCSPAQQKCEYEYNSSVEEWLDAFEVGYLSKEQLLTLVETVELIRQ
jgi:hypothetical protein